MKSQEPGLDEMSLLANTLSEIAPPSQEVVEYARVLLGRAVAKECAGDLTAFVAPAASPGERSWQRAHRSWGIVALSAAAAALVLALGLPALVGQRATPHVKTKFDLTSLTLHRLARIAAEQPSVVPPGPGQYQYTSSVSLNSIDSYGPDTYFVNVNDQRQIWIGANGSGRILETTSDPSFPTPGDYAAWVAAGRPTITGTNDTNFGPGQLTDGPTDLASLPTDPAKLAQMLNSREIEGGPAGPAESFVQIGDLLRETDASPALRSALYEVAASLEGVEALGTVTDHSGRSGVGVADMSGGYEHELIFDSQTSALLGEATIALAGNSLKLATGTVTAWTVYLASGVVDSTTAVVAPK